jgi:hypothetical protein
MPSPNPPDDFDRLHQERPRDPPRAMSLCVQSHPVASTQGEMGDGGRAKPNNLGGLDHVCLRRCNSPKTSQLTRATVPTETIFTAKIVATLRVRQQHWGKPLVWPMSKSCIAPCETKMTSPTIWSKMSFERGSFGSYTTLTSQSI